MKIVVQFKRCIINTNISYIFISKFTYKKELGLIILAVIDKSSKIGFNITLLFFDLAIKLWIKNSE